MGVAVRRIVSVMWWTLGVLAYAGLALSSAAFLGAIIVVWLETLTPVSWTVLGDSSRALQLLIAGIPLLLVFATLGALAARLHPPRGFEFVGLGLALFVLLALTVVELRLSSKTLIDSALQALDFTSGLFCAALGWWFTARIGNPRVTPQPSRVGTEAESPT